MGASTRKRGAKRKSVAVIPAYKAERTVGKVVSLARMHADVIIVVDDGSPDGTAREAKRAGAHVLSHRENRGKAAAIITGISHARKKHAPEFLIMLDSDLQHNPKEIPLLLSPLRKGISDISIGSRFLSPKARGERRMPAHRRIGNLLSSAITSFLTGNRLTDIPSGFRAFNSKAIDTISFQSDGYDIELSSVLEASAHGLRISEVPIETIYSDETSHVRPAKLIIGTLTLWMKWVLSRGSAFRKYRAKSGNS